MAKFKCDCNDNIHELLNTRMKVSGGKVVYTGADCPDCGEQMGLYERKTGIASFSSDRMGRVR